MASNEEKLLKRSVSQIGEHLSDEEFERLAYRDRFRLYFEQQVSANYTFPVFLVLVLYSVFGLIWFTGFYFLVRDPSQEFFSSLNMRKFILYNILHGVLGFGATCGPMGAKNKLPLGACGQTFLTPGTLCSPLFPDFVGLLQKTPGRRSVLGVMAYIVYVAALIWAIIDPCIPRLVMANAALALASVFDFVIFFASRGEHYGYHMFCMMFPDWIAGCQCVQLMLWIMVGFSKCGPWFKYVIQVLMKDAIWTPFLPEHFSAKLFNKDWENQDYSPSRFTQFLAHCGAIGEWVFPLCCLASPGTTINCIGVAGMISYHTFIWSTLPFASVFEWQYYTQFLTYFLYYKNGFALPTSSSLIAFLVVVLWILPIVGQIEPKLVPFLMAYRQYAGNWRLGSILLRKSARSKMEKIKTWNPILHWEAAPPEFGGDRTEYMLGAAFMVVPQFRGLFSVYEKFWHDTGHSPNDFWAIGTFAFTNSVFGWDLAVGWLCYRDCFRTALLDICGFEAGECYFSQIEPAGILPPHRLQYRLFDMVKGPLDAEVYADIPYSDVEGTHPLEVRLKPEQLKSGKSIRGMFLSTYY